MKIKDLQKIDLPREKLAKYGVSKLADYELMAILLSSGIKGVNVIELSKRILKIFSKNGVDKTTLEQLLKIKGLGKAKASQIISIIELGKRLNSSRNPEVVSPEDIWKMCTDFRELKKEHFAAFYFDTQNYLIERQIISIGTLNSSLVHPREVFEPAVKLSAAFVVVAHNHPSGEVKPSDEDAEVTQRLKEAGSLLGIDLTDHVIVTKTGFLSFAQANML